MSPFLVVVRCTLSPVGVAGLRSACATLRPPYVPQPQPFRPSVRLHSAPIIPPHAHPKPPPQMIRRRWLHRCWRFHPLRLGRLVHRSFGQCSPLQLLSLIHQLHPAIPQRPHNHFAPHQTQRLVLSIQLIPLPTTGHGPVALHHPLFLPAQSFV